MALLNVQLILADRPSVIVFLTFVWHPRPTRVQPALHACASRALRGRSQPRFKTRSCCWTSSRSSVRAETPPATMKNMSNGFSEVWLQKRIHNRIDKRTEGNREQRNDTKIIWDEIEAPYLVHDGHIMDGKPAQYKHDSHYYENLSKFSFRRNTCFTMQCLPDRSSNLAFALHTSFDLLKYFEVTCKYKRVG